MVRAVLNESKTQTRRVIKVSPFDSCDEGLGVHALVDIDKCPYGKAGDRLWVRETFLSYLERTFYRATDEGDLLDSLFQTGKPKWKPSIFMPRSHSRIDLEVTGIRVERLNDISEEDAIAEGIKNHLPTPKDAYQDLWDSINGETAPWDSNPWVWVVEFKICQP